LPDIDVLIVGQGLAGSCLAWSLHWAGQRLMIVDRGERVTASRVAAGLITPLTGRRIARTPRYKESYRQASAFYHRIEHERNLRLLTEKPAIRIFVNDDEHRLFEQRFSTSDADIAAMTDEHGKVFGIEMRNAARLNVRRFLDQTRLYFSSLGQYLQADLNPDADIQVADDRVCVASLNICSSAVVFCQGWQPNTHYWFPEIPDGPAKGEILRVTLTNYAEDKVVHKGVWVVPDLSEDQVSSFLVGATYDRNQLNQEPTISGRQELLSGLQQITDETPELIEHVAAVRAGTRRRKPIIGQHPEHDRVFILNGLGSRGALLAPIAADVLKNMLLGDPVSQDLREIIDILLGKSQSDVASKTSQRPKSLTQLAHNMIRRIVQQGDTVVDATAGNGNDTQLLATLVGASGHTIAIDIQQSAIDSTSDRLERAGLVADLRLADHAIELNSLRSAGLQVKAVMFNLGYLPGSDKQITTGAVSTRAAMHAASELLMPGGAVTIIAYRGHAGGLEEATIVEQCLAELPTAQYQTSCIDGDSNNPTSPVLFVVRKTTF
jgi:glycine oxidase